MSKFSTTCNDLTGIQIHDACQIDKAIGCPYIRDIAAPYRIGAFRCELFIQDILEFVTETGIYGGDHLQSYPLGSNPHFLHVLFNSTS